MPPAQVQPAPLPAPPADAPATPADTPPNTAPEEETPEAETPGEVSIQLTRQGSDGKERLIKIVRGGSDEDAFSTICSRQDDEPEDSPSVVVYNNRAAPGVTVLIDKNVITSPLAVITKKAGGDGHIEMSDGTAKDMETVPEKATERLDKCGVEVAPKSSRDTVLVTQGKTQLKGQKLVYDESDGIARIEGPISFKRENEKDPLSGTSEQIDVNVDEESTTLIGNVVLTSAGGRVSKAARVEYDDTLNTARLYGSPEQPAETRKGTEFLQVTCGYLLYSLEENEVVTDPNGKSCITGEFPDDEEQKDEK